MQTKGRTEISALRFHNKDGNCKVAACIDKEYYDATMSDAEFYLVFAYGEDTHCLWYRKSEWKLNFSR